MILNRPLRIPARSNLSVKRRYWRIYVTSNNVSPPGSTWDAVSIAEVAWTDHDGQTVPKPGTVVVTAGSQFSGSYAGPKAYDNNPGTFWSGNHVAPDWIAFDFGVGAAFDLRKVAMKARADSYFTQAPRDFQIQYSSDGVNWTTYWSKSGITWSAGLQLTFNR